MTIPQKKLREAVFYSLFSRDFLSHHDGEDTKEMISMLMQQLEMSQKNVKIAVERGDEILKKKDLLDAMIDKYTPAYGLDRLSCVEKNVLRLAIYELVFDTTIPKVVAIDEGVRLCKKFSTADGAGFVNAVLDAIYKQEHQVMNEL